MSVLFQAVINTGRHTFRKRLNASLLSCKCFLVRKFSDTPRKFLTFDEVVAQRRAEARCSVVVQVNSVSSFNELYGYCSKYASINGIHHYKNHGGEHFMLIEFASEENLKEVLKSCSAHQRDLDVMAVQSPFLWFRAVPYKNEKFAPPDAQLVIEDGTNLIDEDKLFEELLACDTVSDQIQMFYERTLLNDISIRLRYMVARQLETILSSLYANIAVWPFGSSVNGFGRMGCDLDLVLTNVLTDEMTAPTRRLVYQEKKMESGRSTARHMEALAEILQLRLAGGARVTRVLGARVPILQFAHTLAGLDCDLCYNNMRGVHMSALLWTLGSLQWRARALGALVRRWARCVQISAPQPGPTLTGFPLTLMVLFFLQQRAAGGALPSLNQLAKYADKQDIRLAEDNVNCTFLRDLNKLPPDSYGQCSSNLQTLLLQFFEYYSQFDFQNKAISINEGTPVRKPNNSPLYIVNPFEQAVNASRNVSYDECERLKLEVRNAAWQLESCTEGQKGDDWGILALIEKRTTRGLKKLLRVGNSHRLVSVKDLFKDDEDLKDKRLQKSDKGVKETKSLNVKDEKKEQKIKFKNSTIASEVYRIRRDKIV